MTDHEQRLTKLKKQFHGLRIMGGEGVIVHGSPTRGYAVEIQGRAADSGGGGNVFGCTDPTALNFNPAATVDDGSCNYEGACCVDTECSITSEVDCSGVYQGNNTTCDPNPCETGACCFDDFCDQQTEIDCSNLGRDFLGLGVLCDPNPCVCPTPLTYSAFDVQLRIYGNINFRYCDMDCMTGIDDAQAVDFTISLTDHGGGSADVAIDRGDNFPCGSTDTAAQAFLICCRSSCGACAHGEVWEVEIFMDMFFCNNGGTNCGTDPAVGTLSRIEAAVWDPGCENNATHVPIQLSLHPFPNGVYTGTTSFTEQGTNFGVCDTRPVLGGGLGILGDLSIDWQVTIVP